MTPQKMVCVCQQIVYNVAVEKKEELYLAAKEFLTDFSLDFEALAKKLEKVMKCYFALHGIQKSMTISFDESRLFGKSGSVSQTNISFNKTRIEMLVALHLDDGDPQHLKRLEEFYSGYGKKEEHSDFEQILFEFVQKYKDMGAEWAFEKMGSYKTIKFEMLDTILHESEHVFQSEFWNSLPLAFPKNARGKVLTLTCLFNTMFEKMQKSGEKLDYERENHVFPIEFDARYESLKFLGEIKRRYFQGDKCFSNYLSKSNIIPKDFDAAKTARRIFEDYEKVYKLYSRKFSGEFEAANSFLQKNKSDIICELERRYKQMQNISCLAE